jgi:5'-methylthioadenosine phosphorylase
MLQRLVVEPGPPPDVAPGDAGDVIRPSLRTRDRAPRRARRGAARLKTGQVSTAPAPVAVIGGSGLYSLFDEAASESRTIPTPYGAVDVTTGTLGTRSAIFLPRHGTGHSVAPHRIPYRANIWALASLGARAIISTAAVGAVDPAYPVGTLALPDQYLDRTRGRDDTFFDEDDVQHLPSADPFCPELREIAKPTTDKDEATVAVIPGPRFSTRAESVALRQAGAHLVNMTLYPEVPLAAELNIGTVTLAFVTDNDATPSDEPVTAERVFARLKAAQPRIVAAIEAIAAGIPDDYRARELIDPAAVARVLAWPTR